MAWASARVGVCCPVLFIEAKGVADHPFYLLQEGGRWPRRRLPQVLSPRLNEFDLIFSGTGHMDHGAMVP
jgi:hypothetical protein